MMTAVHRFLRTTPYGGMQWPLRGMAGAQTVVRTATKLRLKTSEAGSWMSEASWSARSVPPRTRNSAQPELLIPRTAAP